MDTGLYVNLFEVKFEDCDLTLMLARRSQYTDLRGLRQRLAEAKFAARVFAVGDEVYGYGLESNRLADYGFVPTTVRIGQHPPLASRMVLEGYIAGLEEAGYACEYSFGRVTAYQYGKALLETANGVKLYRGFELQSLYLLDPETDLLVYSIVINPAFAYHDPNGQPLNTHDVVARFGHETLQALRTRQGDLAPRGGINLEVSRQRLMELILPFVAARHVFTLPCGIPAELSQEPIRIVLAGQE